MPSRLNLIPEAAQVSAARRHRLVKWAAAASCSMLAVFIPLTMDVLQRADLRRLQNRNSRLQSELDQARGALRSITGELAQVRLQSQRAEVIRKKRAWSGLLALFADALPARCWITSLATDPPAGANTAQAQPPTGVPKPSDKPPLTTVEAPRKLRLSGYAADASLPHVFVKTLKETSVFAQVNLQKSIRETTGDGACFRFDVECEW